MTDLFEGLVVHETGSILRDLELALLDLLAKLPGLGVSHKARRTATTGRRQLGPRRPGQGARTRIGGGTSKGASCRGDSHNAGSEPVSPRRPRAVTGRAGSRLGRGISRGGVNAEATRRGRPAPGAAGRGSPGDVSGAEARRSKHVCATGPSLVVLQGVQD